MLYYCSCFYEEIGGCNKTIGVLKRAVSEKRVPSDPSDSGNLNLDISNDSFIYDSVRGEKT